MFKKKVVRPSGPLTQSVLRDWLVEYVAGHLKVGEDDIDTSVTFEAFGLDSRTAVQVSGALEKVVERRLSPGLLYEYQTIDELSAHLAKELG
ncbi:acyl carrier protein [Streptomyces cyaneus]|uniref:acyl carrier protein n=1 Tax=Streptomyces cyaneus TaxID=1904 RepID=UPI000FF89FED|nr:acyl carrier protein [Streptomyces cyaneus]